MADIQINVKVVEGQAIAAMKGLEAQTKATDKALSGVNKTTSKLGNQLKSAFNGTPIQKGIDAVDGFGSKILGINPYVAALTVAITAMGAAIKLAFVGEEINAINAQFELLSTQAGATSDELKSALESVAQGTIDTEDILKSTNKFITEFSGNTKRIPEVLDLARKATALFGGEVTDNFERIGEAIASGNTRSLRALGIIVDQESAYKNFAKSIGLTADQLSDAGKKQAFLDAVLEKGNQAFQNVDPNIRGLATSFEKLKVQIGETGDTLATKTTAVFGSFFKSILDSAGKSLEEYNLRVKETPSGFAGLEIAIQKTELSIRDLDEQMRKSKIAVGSNRLDSADFLDISLLQERKDKLLKTLEDLQTRQIKFNVDSKANADAAVDTNSKYGDATKLAQNAEEILKIKNETAVADYQQMLINDGQFTSYDELALSTFKFNLEQKTLLEEAETQKRLGNKQNALKIEAQLEAGRTKYFLNQREILNKIEKQKEEEHLKNREKFLSTLATLQSSSNKTLLTIGRAAATASVLINGAESRSASFKYGAALGGPPLGYLFEGLAIAAQAAQIAQINGVKFAQGGIVPGNSFSGDQVQARLNSGEMVLNKQQQANLFSMANSGGQSGQIVEVHNVIQLDGEVVARSVSRQVANGLKLGEVV